MIQNRKRALNTVEKLIVNVHSKSINLGLKLNIEDEKLKEIDRNITNAYYNLVLGNE